MILSSEWGLSIKFFFIEIISYFLKYQFNIVIIMDNMISKGGILRRNIYGNFKFKELEYNLIIILK